MKNRQTINDTMPNWLLGSGIFNALDNYDVPWRVADIANELDMEYHGNISGDKYISPLVRKMKAGDTLTDAEMKSLAGVIYTLYKDNWEKEWETMNLQYDPIENYRMVEKMSDDITTDEYGRTHTRTDNTTHAKTGTETESHNLTDRNTPNVTELTTPNLTDTSNNAVYGFNSSNASPTGTSTNAQTGTNTVTRSGTDTTTHTGSDTMTHNTTDRNTGTVTDADTGTDTHTRNYKLTRSGNVGVTTSQQMIQSQRDLYMWNLFYNVVFPDIDRVLTLSVY